MRVITFPFEPLQSVTIREDIDIVFLDFSDINRKVKYPPLKQQKLKVNNNIYSITLFPVNAIFYFYNSTTFN